MSNINRPNNGHPFNYNSQYAHLREEEENTHLPHQSSSEESDGETRESSNAHLRRRKTTVHFHPQEMTTIFERLSISSFKEKKPLHLQFQSVSSVEVGSSSDESDDETPPPETSDESQEDYIALLEKSDESDDKKPPQEIEEKKRDSIRRYQQLSPRNSANYDRIFNPKAVTQDEARKSLGGANEFETISEQLRKKEIDSKLKHPAQQQPEELPIDLLMKMVSRHHKTISLKTGYGLSKTPLVEKTSEKKKSKTSEAIKDFSEAMNEIFDKMTEILDDHRLYKSLSNNISEKQTKKTSSHSEKFHGTKYVSKADSPVSILSQEAFIERVKEKLKKAQSYISKDSEHQAIADALFELDIAHLNSLYFILNRFVNIASKKLNKDYIISLEKLLNLVEETLFKLAQGKSTPPLQATSSLARQSSSQPLLQFDDETSKQRELINPREELIKALGNIAHIEKSKDIYQAFIAYTSHKLCEQETAKFFHQFHDFQEKHDEMLRLQRKTIGSSDGPILSPRLQIPQQSSSQLTPPLSPRSLSLREQMLEGKQRLTEINEKKKLAYLETELKELAKSMLEDVSNGTLNIDTIYCNNAKNILKEYPTSNTSLPNFDKIKEFLAKVRGALHMNCTSRLGCKGILSSSNEDDNVFIMSEPFFRLFSDKGLPVFTRKEIKQFFSLTK